VADVPSPEAEITAGEFAALLTIVTLPVKAPAVVGAKTSSRVAV